jgi:putative ABC transport system permease protein
VNNLKHAVRMFLRAPGFTLTALAALALGIGANVAIFSVANTVLLRPVPAPDPDHVVVFMTNRADGTFINGASPARFNAWRELGDLFTDISAYRYGAINLTGSILPVRFSGGRFRPIISGSSGSPQRAGAPLHPRKTAPTRGALRSWATGSGNDPSRPIHKSWEKRFHWAAILTRSSGSCHPASRRKRLCPSISGPVSN